MSEAVAPRYRTAREIEVLKVLASHDRPMTDDEISAIVGFSSVATRRILTGLVRVDDITKSPAHFVGSTNIHSGEYRITESTKGELL